MIDFIYIHKEKTLTRYSVFNSAELTLGSLEDEAPIGIKIYFDAYSYHNSFFSR